MLPTPILLSSEQRQKRFLTQDVLPFSTTSSFGTPILLHLKQKPIQYTLFP